MTRKAGFLRGMALVAAASLAGCATHYDRYGYRDWYGGGPAYHGDDYQARDHQYGPIAAGMPFFRGDGASVLDPWLAFTPEGRDIVSRGFHSRDGRISMKTAHRANIWFRRYADTNNDLALTDPEIRTALVQAARMSGDRSY